MLSYSFSAVKEQLVTPVRNSVKLDISCYDDMGLNPPILLLILSVIAYLGTNSDGSFTIVLTLSIGPDVGEFFING